MRSRASARRIAGAREISRAPTRRAPVATALVAGALAALAPAASASRPVACPAATTAVTARAAPAVRAALRCVVDAERARHGLGPLRADRRLARAANRHARDMVRNRYFAHERSGWTLSTRLSAAGWSGARAAEAIAWGCGGRSSALATMRSWLKSPPHRAILLGPYQDAGVGLAASAPTRDCPRGATWVLDVGS